MDTDVIPGTERGCVTDQGHSGSCISNFNTCFDYKGTVFTGDGDGDCPLLRTSLAYSQYLCVQRHVSWLGTMTEVSECIDHT